jgi:hypothetical protein
MMMAQCSAIKFRQRLALEKNMVNPKELESSSTTKVRPLYLQLRDKGLEQKAKRQRVS